MGYLYLFYLRLSWVRRWAADKIAERFVDDLFDGEDARGDAHRASARRRLIEGHAAGLGARLGRSVVGDRRARFANEIIARRSIHASRRRSSVRG